MADDISQLDISALKLSLLRNICSKLSAADTFQPDKSPVSKLSFVNNSVCAFAVFKPKAILAIRNRFFFMFFFHVC